MRRYCRVMIVALLGCGLAGCGAAQPPPPTDLSKLPSDPMGGAVPKKGSLKKASGLPSLPSMPIAGTKR
jgi:hypothetical protein